MGTKPHVSEIGIFALEARMNSASLTGNATYAMTSAIKKASQGHLWAGGCSEGEFMLLAKVADPPQRTISTRLSGGGFRPLPRDRADPHAAPSGAAAGRVVPGSPPTALLGGAALTGPASLTKSRRTCSDNGLAK